MGGGIAVIVPIQRWRDIESERETAYLSRSDSMKARPLQGAQRQTGLSFEEVVDVAAFEDLACWIENDPTTVLPIDQANRLVY